MLSNFHNHVIVVYQTVNVHVDLQMQGRIQNNAQMNYFHDI